MARDLFAAVQQALGDLYTLDRENKAFCGRPCKKDAECAAGQACVGTGSKVQGAGTAHDVIDICAASKAPARSH